MFEYSNEPLAPEFMATEFQMKELSRKIREDLRMIEYEISAVEIKELKSGWGLRYNVTERLPGGAATTFRGCLAGLDGAGVPWAHPPRGFKGYDIIYWNKPMQDIVTKTLEDAGEFDRIRSK